jgi:RHS repeat-associated protein
MIKQDSSPLAGEGQGEGDSSIPIPLFFKEGLGGIFYTYDKNGNLTKKVELDDEGNIKKTTLYSYDFENRLTKVEIHKGDKQKVVTFTYDPFGRRLSKSVFHQSLRGEAEAISEDDDDNYDDKDSILSLSKDDDDKVTQHTTYYVYDNEDIILEYNHKGKVRARYVHGLGIDEPLAIIFPHIHIHKKRIEWKSKVYYYHFDGLGSVTALTNKEGKVIQRYDYDSFGKLKRHGHKVKNAYTYTAREYDRETGLYYYRMRYYDPMIGRFLQKDPILGSIDLPQTLNPYPYTANNPLLFIDPFGLRLCRISLPGMGQTYLDDAFSPIVSKWINTNLSSGINIAFTQAFRTSAYQQTLLLQ